MSSSRLNFIRPSVLGVTTTPAPGTNADDEKPVLENLAANPFIREDLDTSNSAGSTEVPDTKTESETDDKLDPLTLLNKNGLPKSNLFAQVAKAGSGSGFVFGQNVHERVVGVSMFVFKRIVIMYFVETDDFSS